MGSDKSSSERDFVSEHPSSVSTVERVHNEAVKVQRKTKCEKQERQADHCKELMKNSNLNTRQVELISTNGASSWLTVLPLKEHGFYLSKTDN